MDKSLVDLAAIIPIRNVNFYIDAYRAMQRVADGHQRAVSILSHRVRANGSNRVTGDMKLVGHFMLMQFCEEVDKVDKKECGIEILPEYFFTQAILKDAKLHGDRLSHSFVMRVLNELAGDKIEHSGVRERFIKDRGMPEEDMAELFLAFSLAAKGALRPIVSFPAHPAGFIARLALELGKLLPSGSAFRKWR